ncbi:MAG: SIS domain-containing protein [Oscillochloris sp.]|nr:SIS domain-containing protein [Oscillochloris sp.]
MAVVSYEAYAEEYLARHLTFLSTLPTKTIGMAADVMWNAHERGATIFLCGNGGSASMASHFAADLSKTTIVPQHFAQARRFKAVSLADNMALLTAWGNDVAYEQIFAEQLRNLAGPDDVLVAISGSGTSPNVVAAVMAAAEIGMTTVGLTGQTGGRLRGDCDICICVDSDAYEHNEPLHSVTFHLIAFYLRQRLYAQTTGEE